MYVYDVWGDVAGPFNPDAFIDHYDVYSELKSMKKNPVETFNELLMLDKNIASWDRKSNDPCYDIVCEYKGSKVHYFYILREEALRNFNLHSAQGNRTKITDETFKSEMKQLGWDYDRKKMNGIFKLVFYRDTFEERCCGDSDSGEGGESESSAETDAL
jgi:hypothetical protein